MGETCQVLNMSGLPLPGIKADRIVELRSLKKGRLYDNVIAEYVARRVDKGVSRVAVVPLGGADMARLAPDLFALPHAARTALKKKKK